MARCLAALPFFHLIHLNDPMLKFIPLIDLGGNVDRRAPRRRPVPSNCTTR